MGFQQDSTPEYSYDAFLSFRGEDIRDGFADTVCARLRQAGIRTFRDSDDVNKGKKFDTEIVKAIERSKIAVILFTEKFASSIFCLKEVSLFMKRWREKTAEVLPVFYMVEPDDGWAKDGGHYSGCFKDLEQEFNSRFQREKEELEKKRCEMKKGVGKKRTRGPEIRFQEQMRKLKADYKQSLLDLDNWKTDLGEVAQITGHPRHAEIMGHPPEATNNRRYIFKGDWSVEAFISEVVEDAWHLAKPVIFDVPRMVFGREDIVSGLGSWVQTEQPNERIALLHGIKGIGKATIAAVVSKANYHLFEAVAFVGKVEEKCKQPDGVLKLQEQLIKRIKNSKSIQTCLSDEEGRESLKAALNDKRVLIVLKDLDTEGYFRALIGEPGDIDGKVKVIVTSGNQNLLPVNSCVKFYVGPLTKEQSRELLQWEAHQWDPNFAVDVGTTLVDNALESCGRIPSLIKSLPALLKAGKDVLSTELPRIHQILQKTRFESLEEDDKDLFLDIACFYADREYDHVKSALNNWHYGLRSVAGFERLQGLHWVSVNGNSRVSMDQLVKDMGRRMVCRKAESTLHRQSHIWSPEDASNLLRRCNGTEHTRSIILDPKLVEISASTTKMMEYKSQAFARLTGLQLVQLFGVKLQGDYEGFPDDLVWLSWEGVPVHPMPADWKDLLSVDWFNDSLQKNLDQRQSLNKLKILNLSCCHSLERTPDFTTLEVPNLERLIIENCILLKEIHPSIQQLAKLVQLNLRGCRSLVELRVLGSSVKVLDISLCTGIRGMPNGRIESVEELRADHIEVDQLLEEQDDFSFSAVFPSLVKLSLVGSCKQSFGTIVSDLATLASLKYVDKDLFPALSEAVGPSISLCVLS